MAPVMQHHILFHGYHVCIPEKKTEAPEEKKNGERATPGMLF
jgi:hypothetical protein